MNGYSQLRELLCKDIDKGLNPFEANEIGIGKYNVLERKHIFLYLKIKGVEFNSDRWLQVLSLFDNKLPLSSQDEVCKKIYDYLITL